MNSLPIEMTHWREHLKRQIDLETAILRVLIQWGMVESALDVCRSLEEHFCNASEPHFDKRLPQSVQPSAEDRAFVRDLLQKAYLRTRQIPRRETTQERLHDGLLTGFEGLALEILRCYRAFSGRGELGVLKERAA
jgi:hypothetical protein